MERVVLMDTDITLEQRVDGAWEAETPARVVKGGEVLELKGAALKRASLYFAQATHSVTVPYTKRITAGATRCKIGGKTYLVGAALNESDACRTLELFLCEQTA